MKKILLAGLVLASNVFFAQKKPNVLFIAVDDLKPLIHDYGYDQAITPNIDRLMKSSVTFNNAYCQFPVCGPSRASIMTGLRPETNGVLDLKTDMRVSDPNCLTIPEHFKKNGYTTASTGKIYDPRCIPNKQEGDKQSWTLPYVIPHGEYNGDETKKLAVEAIGEEEGHADTQIAEQGIKFINQLASKKEPFFIATGFKKPHLPFIAPKKYFDLYDPSKFSIEKFQKMPKGGLVKYLSSKNTELLTYNPTPAEGMPVTPYAPYVANGGHVTEAQQRELLHGYFACVSFVDAQIGKVLDALEKSGQAENTIVILWGDHGFHLGDHGLWGKHTTMEQAARVPLIIKAPGVKAAKTSSLAEFVDVFPTLCDLAGLKKPEKLEGTSLVPVLKDAKKSVNDVAITQYKRGQVSGYSMRTNQYRYTEWINADKTVAYVDLYDMINDPNETENIAEKKPEVVKELAALLRVNKQGYSKL